MGGGSRGTLSPRNPPRNSLIIPPHTHTMLIVPHMPPPPTSVATTDYLYLFTDHDDNYDDDVSAYGCCSLTYRPINKSSPQIKYQTEWNACPEK